MGLSTMTDQELARKITVLDARDKILRQRMAKQTELSQASFYIGSCEDMCPERERYTRLGFQLSIFERDEQNQPDEYAMIKEYRRAGADQEEPLPHDLRTPKALETTVDYLVCNIMDDPRSKSSELALHWYDFLWDRLRAIRKDITQQNICDQTSAILVERCARFHVHSCYAMTRVKDFDVDMNKRNLNDCLQMLRQIYNDLRTTTGLTYSSEFEFQKYDILLHLGEDALTTNVLMKTSNHSSFNEMKFITQVFSAYCNNNYYKFFKLVESSDYMTSCILGLYVNKVRLSALRTIISSCSLRQSMLYSADLLIDTLAFDDLEDLTTFVSSLGIKVQEKDSKHYLILEKETATNIRQLAQNLPPLKSRKLIENKMMGRSVGQLVYGLDSLPENPYKKFPLQTSDDLYRKVVEDSQFYKQADGDQELEYEMDADEVEESYPDCDEVEEGEDQEDEDLMEEDYDEDRESDDVYGEQEDDSNDEEDESTDDNMNQEKEDSEKQQTYELYQSPSSLGSHDLDSVVEEENESIRSIKLSSNDDDQETNQNQSISRFSNNTSNEFPIDGSSTKNTVDEVPIITTQPNEENSQDSDDSCEFEYYDEEPLKIKKLSKQVVADMMPAGKMRHKLKLPKMITPVTKSKLPISKVMNSKKKNNRISEIDVIKQCTLDEDYANKEFFRIVRMII